MAVIYWLIPLSIIILVAAVAIFFWAVRSGQFQDLDSPAVDILFDHDDKVHSDITSRANEKNKNDQTLPKTDNTQ